LNSIIYSKVPSSNSRNKNVPVNGLYNLMIYVFDSPAGITTCSKNAVTPLPPKPRKLNKLDFK